MSTAVNHESFPQVYTPGTDSQKEVYHAPAGLEVAPQAAYANGQQQHYYQQGQYPQQERRIWGLRRTTFILVVVLVAVVVIGAVGGGVGGGLAVKSAQTQCLSDFAALAPKQTVTVTETIVTTGTVATTIAPTRSPTSGSASGRVVAPTQGLLALNCPQIGDTTQSVFLYPNTVRFSARCGMDLNGADVDILAIVAYSFEDCMRACASFNRNAGSSACKGVEFNADYDVVVPNYFGTCWLKKFTTGQAADSNTSNANLHVAGILLT